MGDRNISIFCFLVGLLKKKKIVLFETSQNMSSCATYVRIFFLEERIVLVDGYSVGGKEEELIRKRRIIGKTARQNSPVRQVSYNHNHQLIIMKIPTSEHNPLPHHMLN